jgi:hypothetical protein
VKAFVVRLTSWDHVRQGKGEGPLTAMEQGKGTTPLTTAD